MNAILNRPTRPKQSEPMLASQAMEKNPQKQSEPMSVIQAMKMNPQIKALSRAISLNPKDATAYIARAKVWAELEHWHQAISDYAEALSRAPDCWETHMELAKLWCKVGDIENVLEESLYACYLNPQPSADDCSFMGHLFMQLQHGKSAIQAFERALAVDPGHLASLIALGTIFVNNKLIDEGIELLQKALTIDSQLDDQKGIAYVMFANALSEKTLYKEAEDAYQKALELLPKAQKVLVYENRGNHRENANKLTAALDDFNKVIAYDPKRFAARESRSVVLLKLGDYKKGWSEFEQIFYKRRFVISADLDPNIYKTPWQGEGLVGRRLLVRCDDGNGDTFQMIRYLPLLKQRGAIIILQVSANLIDLLKTLPQLGVSEWVITNSPPSFDYYTSTMLLPCWFKTELATIPSIQPAWKINLPARQRLPKTEKQLRVGLVWSGNPLHNNDKNRSVPLSLLEPLFVCPQIAFYSVQCSNRSQDIQKLGWEDRIVDLEPQIKSWVDTAQFISELDLLITVDTAMAHLSASLGKPTWIMLPFCPDFRWLVDRADSPWYPSARLFRQKQANDWSSVITEITAALQELAADIS